jgi:hypothetical protein
MTKATEAMEVTEPTLRKSEVQVIAIEIETGTTMMSKRSTMARAEAMERATRSKTMLHKKWKRSHRLRQVLVAEARNGPKGAEVVGRVDLTGKYEGKHEERSCS